MLKRVLTFGLTAWLSAVGVSSALAQAFTFQGYLRDSSGNPINQPAGLSMTFTLFNHPSNTGASFQVGSPITQSVPVRNGLFTVELNFGNVWDGSDRWLQIQINTTPPTVLSPRVKINPTPYAIRAATAGTANPIGAAGGDLSGTYPNPTVARLQGRAVHNAAPADGQVLKWNATFNRWEPAPDLRDAFWQASGSNIFYNAGNVGIGTNNPAHPLHVVSSTGTMPVIHAESATAHTVIQGLSLDTSGQRWGVRGESRSPEGAGVTGYNGVPNGKGVFGQADNRSGGGIGVWGLTYAESGVGVSGESKSDTGVNYGVKGQNSSTSVDSAGVLGIARATSGNASGVRGISRSPTGRGVYGLMALTTGANIGVFGESRSPEGTGVYGLHAAATGTAPGVHGTTSSTSAEAVGVLGEVASTSPGAYSAAVRGINRGTGGLGIGVWGSQDGSGWGVYGTSVSGIGVYGSATANTGAAWGVWGETRSRASNAYGVVGVEPFASGDDGNRGPGHAVYGFGSIAATGTKAFQIDHPLRPETHYLNHFCAEGPEPYNIYSGVVALDARGEAWVQLPDYFEAINRDPRYTLTPIGAPMPNLHIAVKIQNNRFKIAGGVPGMEVSWEVKAIRNDLWVQRYGYETEQEKEDEIKGKYLHPELYGQPKERGILYRPEPASKPGKVVKP